MRGKCEARGCGGAGVAQVVGQCGVLAPEPQPRGTTNTNTISNSNSSHSHDTVTLAANAALVSDALEVLIAAAAPPPAAEPGAGAAHKPPATASSSALRSESGVALDALASWLGCAAQLLTAPDAQPPAAPGAQGAPPDAVPGGWRHVVGQGALQAMELLKRLLALAPSSAAASSSPEGQAAAEARLLASRPHAAAALVAALAALLGNPRLAAGRAASQPQAGLSGGHAAAEPAGGEAAAAPAGGGDVRAAAQLQLHALHLLILLLRAALHPAAADVARELAALDRAPAAGAAAQLGAGGRAESWSAAARRGLSFVLRSRVPVAIRHAALQAAACVVELAPRREAWLLGPGGAGGEAPGGFLQLLAEMLNVSGWGGCARG
jgi:hypothetical protein